jgi:hypothetical protein
VRASTAFGIFANVLDAEVDEFKLVRQRVEGIELADSITVDGHKMLNVVSLILPPFYNGISFLLNHPDSTLTLWGGAKQKAI